MNLYIYKYNNYYNRIVKKEDALAGYGTPIHSLFNCKDFSPNDGVNTTHVFGSAANNYDGSGDYLIVADDNGNILSHWFIIEINFARNGQWMLTLRRDLVVDYYNDIINADCFIEKATLNIDDILIFNDEQYTVNQIKTNETLLKDQSDCPWLVGYYAADATDIQGTVPANNLSSIPFVQLTTPINDWEYYKYQGTTYALLNPTNARYRTLFLSAATSGNGYIDCSIEGEYVEKLPVASSVPTASLVMPYAPNEIVFNTYANAYANNIKEQKETLKAMLPDYIENLETEELLTFQNAYVRDSDGKVFKVAINRAGLQYRQFFDGSGELATALLECALNAGFTGYASANTFFFFGYFDGYTVSLTEQKDLETTYNVTQSGRLITEDAPWNIFAIPYGSITVKNSNDETLVETTKEIAIQTAMGIQKQHQSKIFDIQLLPYCPIQDLITDKAEMTVSSTAQYSLITSPVPDSDPLNVGIIFNLPRSRFDFNLVLDTPLKAGTSAIEKKVNNQCDKWRIAAPNYSNYFDFSVEKNNGVEYFNVDCEYKPFTPYIHINPNFKNLYGEDFNDVRGLVLGGDFSLSQIIDQWEQYQIQNKNFQNIFDRQIQNMEINNSITRTQEIISGIAGSGQTAAAGAMTGSMVGTSAGPAGAIIGGVIGGVAGIAGGIADLVMSEALRTEAMDYTKDMFGYQLGNIQALPQTISKVSALNNNNKLFPVLEYYTCTDREKEAFIKKIKHNGMSVMVIDTIAAYLNNQWSIVINDKTISNRNYIKGQIILMENLDDEFHLLKEISNEIYKGVYF